MSVPHSAPKTAAFVRVEGALLGASDVGASLFMALNAPGNGSRLARLGAFAASLPFLGAFSLSDRRKARRLAYLHTRGLSADRIDQLGAELYPRFFGDRVRAGGLEIVARARRDGHSVVLITSGLESALAPLKELVGADDLIGSRLEMREGTSTGRLLEPFSDDLLVRYAETHMINLGASYGYGADAADLPMLKRVGFPCAVNPDRALRLAAEAERWPILDVRT